MDENKVLRFLSEYAEGKLYDAEQEQNSKKSKVKFNEYAGMREIIDALIDELKV